MSRVPSIQEMQIEGFRCERCVRHIYRDIYQTVYFPKRAIWGRIVSRGGYFTIWGYKPTIASRSATIALTKPYDALMAACWVFGRFEELC